MKAKCKNCGGTDIEYPCDWCGKAISPDRNVRAKYCTVNCGSSARQKKYRGDMKEKARKYDEEHKP